MADWYVSSAAYAGYSAFSTKTYSVGDIVVPTAPALKAKWVFRCTTAGLSTTEPSWPTANNSTVSSGAATFTNVTGQSTYFWTAAAGDILTLGTTSNRLTGGDRVFISSDHSESQTSAGLYGGGTTLTPSSSVIQFLCVNRGGSTPPVAADITTGAAVASTNTISFFVDAPIYIQGVAFTTSSTSATSICLNSASATFPLYLKNCSLANTSVNTGAKILANGVGGFFWTAVLDNTTISFGATGQTFTPVSLEWRNTASALAGSTPSAFITAAASTLNATFRGVDVSSITGTLVKPSSAQSIGNYLFDSCKIAAGVTAYGNSSTETADVVELVNCYDGTNIRNERYAVGGVLTTERTITLASGAADDVGAFSHKMVSTANVDKFANTFNSFWMDVENTLVGTSRTATVEINSSSALNNDQISLLLEYQGTSTSSVASFGSTFITTPLTMPAAVTTSTATWNSSPSTPAPQKLQVTFTPQVAGRVRGIVRLGAASTTVYVNPQIKIV